MVVVVGREMDGTVKPGAHTVAAKAGPTVWQTRPPPLPDAVNNWETTIIGALPPCTTSPPPPQLLVTVIVIVVGLTPVTIAGQVPPTTLALVNAAFATSVAVMVSPVSGAGEVLSRDRTQLKFVPAPLLQDRLAAIKRGPLCACTADGGGVPRSASTTPERTISAPSAPQGPGARRKAPASRELVRDGDRGMDSGIRFLPVGG